MYVCSCSTNQCSIVHSSTSWQRCETQVHFNDVVAPPAAEHGSGTDSCMYVCMYVCKSLLVSMILHSLAGTVESVDWRAQGQDCSHRERGQSSFDMSLAW